MSWYHKLNEERSYHRHFFLCVSLTTAAACSLFPMMCFKNYSSKERAKGKQKLDKIDRRIQEGEQAIQEAARRVRHRSHSPQRTARMPQDHHRRRHSSAVPSGHHYHQRDGRNRDEDTELRDRRSPRRRPESRHAYDRELDRERRERHHGHPPPRRYHHSS